MKKWVVVLILMALGLCGESSVGRAQDGNPWQFGQPGRWGLGFASRPLAMLDNDRVKAALNLTDQQSNELRKIFVESEEATVKARADLEVRGIELRELLRADKPDREAVMSKAREMSELRQKLMEQHLDALLSAKAVLTPEQQKKIRSFLESHGEGGMRGQGFGERFPRRPPRPEAPPEQ